MASDDNSSAGRSGWRRWLPRDPWQVILGPLLIVVAGAGITALVSGGEEEERPDLRPLAPTVVNGEDESEILDTNEETGEVRTRQAEPAKPRIELRLHNVGTQRSVLTSARFELKRHVRIAACGVGAGLLESASYDVMLPGEPARDEVVEVPINQQLGPDEADRFSFRLSTPEAYKDDLGTTVIYEIGISVLHDDAPEPLKAGEVVVAVPATPARSDADPQAPYSFFAPGCVPAPPPETHVAASFSGVRSLELTEFLSFLGSQTG